MALGGQTHALARDVVVTDVRISVTGAQTRIVINLSDSAQVEPFTVADPYRLVLNLPGTVWKLPKSAVGAKGGLIKGFRFGPLGPGRSRVVFDLAGPAKLTDNLMLPPQGERRYRLVLDLLPEDDAVFRRSAGWPDGDAPGSNTADLAQDPKRPARARKLICLDPGHGGIDPGAVGVSGTLEKTIVLEASQRIREMLVKTNRYDVIMTRDSDTFLSLKARVAACRKAAADLMISVHADSAGKADAVRGATVYTLSEKASDAEAEELAQSENQSDVIAGVDLGKEDDAVTGILIGLAQRETKANSIKFAKTLMPELQKTGRTVDGRPKFAGFRVLKAPDVPSVLLEMGYLTNAEDEVQLLSEQWRAQLSKAVLQALDLHFGQPAKR